MSDDYATLHITLTDGTEMAYTVLPIKVCFTRSHLSFTPEYEQDQYIDLDDIESVSLVYDR